jgi:prevent-host-death family protein
MYLDSIKDIRPISDFRQNTAAVVARVKETGAPTILTINGRPELVLIDSERYQQILEKEEYWANVKKINRALAGVRAGNVMSWEQGMAEFDKLNAKYGI